MKLKLNFFEKTGITVFCVTYNRDVTVYRLIAKDTIEEAILQCAQNKLLLERDMNAMDGSK